jgi:hypothetical protein
LGVQLSGGAQKVKTMTPPVVLTSPIAAEIAARTSLTLDERSVPLTPTTTFLPAESRQFQNGEIFEIGTNG